MADKRALVIAPLGAPRAKEQRKLVLLVSGVDKQTTEWRSKLKPLAGQALRARLRSGGLILMGRISSVSKSGRF